MAKGAPDYSKMVLLQALDGSGKLIPVLLDASGKIISVLQGIDGSTLRTLATDSNGFLKAVLQGTTSVSGDVNATDQNTVKQIQGTDGSVYRTAKVDTNGQFIMVPRGSNGNYMLVDSNGFLASLMKGSDAGTLRTIAVDQNGYMLGKIYDPQDLFGANTVIGLSELAARLGSPMNYDRRGQIAWYDTFEGTSLKWNTSISGAGASAALSTEDAYMGSSSLKLVAGSDNNPQANAERYLLTNQVTRCGFEVAFSFVNPTILPSYIQFELELLDGAHHWTAYIKFTPGSRLLQYKNSSGVWVNIDTDLGVPQFYKVWFKLKFVADFTTAQYVRVMYGSKTADLSTISLQDGVNTNPAMVKLGIYVWGAGGNNPGVYIDDVVYTVNEP